MKENLGSDVTADVSERDQTPPSVDLSLPLKGALKRPVRMFTARLSRRIVFWIFISVIAIETIIFFPSLRNRERELLDQLKEVSATKIAVLMQTIPPEMSETQFLETAQRVLMDDLIVGMVLFRGDGTEIGVGGQRPALTFHNIIAEGRFTRLDRISNRYDVASGGAWQNGHYFLVLRHDTSTVRAALYAFFLRIAGLVVIISVFVTAGAMIALGPIVLTPILKLRRDLEAAGDAVSNDQPSPQFQSAAMRREDELGDVIGAFREMFDQITDAISHRKQAQNELKQTFRQLEEYSLALDSELEKGREIQKNFLPSDFPELAGWELAAYFKPARQVAGDYYDVFHLPERKIGIVIADVCDKGVGAALFMALFRSLIRIFSGQFEVNTGACHISSLAIDNADPEGDDTDHNLPTVDLEALQAVAHTNNYVARNHGDLGMFATLFFGVLDPQTGALSYINAGHDPLIVLAGPGGVRQRLIPTGPAVGLTADARFRMALTQIEPGETLLGYTDGVPEATSQTGELFGTARLITLFGKTFDTAAELTTLIADQVQAHTGAAEQFDDITMLALRRGKA